MDTLKYHTKSYAKCSVAPCSVVLPSSVQASPTISGATASSTCATSFVIIIIVPADISLSSLGTKLSAATMSLTFPCLLVPHDVLCRLCVFEVASLVGRLVLKPSTCNTLFHFSPLHHASHIPFRPPLLPASTMRSPTPPPPAGTNNAAEAKRMAEEREKEQEAYRATCDKYVRTGLSRNVTVQFLIDRLVKMGCTPPKGFIKCMDCGDKMAGGGFGVVEETVVAKEISDDVASRADNAQCHRTDEDLRKQLDAADEGKVKLRLLPEIFLCQQHLRNETHAHEAMVHELIHAIDLCRTKMDPLNNCMHMACTEIRAENLSGECEWMRELGKGKISKFAGHGAECAKRRATLSVQANPKCRDKAREYVEAAFERCYQDTFPFDRHPNRR